MIEFRDLSKDIVFAKNDEAFTDSKTIAKELNRRHDNVLQIIRECIREVNEINNEYSQVLTFKELLNIRQLQNKGTKKEPYFIINEEAFLYLMMRLKGKKATEIRLKFIYAFKLMKEWIKDRAVGRGIRLSMTDSIKNYLPESPNKKFKYKHFTDLVYKKVFGKSKKQIETELNKPIDNLRDICTSKQLQDVERYENEISIFLKYGYSYDEIKSKLL